MNFFKIKKALKKVLNVFNALKAHIPKIGSYSHWLNQIN